MNARKQKGSHGPLQYLNVGLKGEAGRQDNVHLVADPFAGALAGLQAGSARGLGAGRLCCLGSCVQGDCFRTLTFSLQLDLLQKTPAGSPGD